MRSISERLGLVETNKNNSWQNDLWDRFYGNGKAKYNDRFYWVRMAEDATYNGIGDNIYQFISWIVEHSKTPQDAKKFVQLFDTPEILKQIYQYNQPAPTKAVIHNILTRMIYLIQQGNQQFHLGGICKNDKKRAKLILKTIERTISEILPDNKDVLFQELDLIKNTNELKNASKKRLKFGGVEADERAKKAIMAKLLQDKQK